MGFQKGQCNRKKKTQLIDFLIDYIDYYVQNLEAELVKGT